MKKRVLWLVYKDLLCTSDIPELLAKGYEVYTAKKISWEARAEGVYLTDRFDVSLSIDSDLKAKLDDQDFFTPLSDEFWNQINENFDLVFIDYYCGQFETVLERFNGSIVLRTLGIPECGSYSEQLCQDHGLHIFNQINRLYYRFWFAPAYSWLLECEANVMQQRYVELPFSVQEVAPARERERIEKVYFLCPQIKLREASEKLYWDTLALFKPQTGRQIPYTVCGNQYLACDYDADIEGEIEEKRRLENLRNYACVYAPQERMGEVDSYILKAFVQDTPVVFNYSCGLQKISKNILPGAYVTAAEARKKLSRLLHGDQTLREEIVGSQRKILGSCLNPKRTHEKFQRGLDKIEKGFTFRTHKVPMDPYIGIVLLDKYSEFTMFQVESILAMLQNAAQKNGERIKFCLGYPQDQGYEEHNTHMRKVEESGVPIRKYKLQSEDQRWLSDMLNMKGYPDMLLERESFALNDGNTYFEDCAALLLVLNRNVSTNINIPEVITTRPFGVFVPDYDVDIYADAQNRRREAMNIQLQRMAKFVLLTDNNSAMIASGRNGISKAKIETVSSLMAPVPLEGDMYPEGDGRYFLYFVNGQDPASVYMAERAVKDYYLKGGELSVLFVWQNLSQRFKLLVWNAEQYKEYLTRASCGAERTDFHIIEDQGNVAELTSELLVKIMRDAQFSFMPDLFDMQRQIVSWLIALNIRTICLETASVKALAEEAEAELNYVTEKDVSVFSNKICLATQLNRPEAGRPDRLFAQYENDSLYQVIKRRFGVF